jgi:hypothetical protein
VKRIRSLRRRGEGIAWQEYRDVRHATWRFPSGPTLSNQAAASLLLLTARSRTGVKCGCLVCRVSWRGMLGNLAVIVLHRRHVGFDVHHGFHTRYTRGSILFWQTIDQIKANAEQQRSEPDSRFTPRDTLARPLHLHPH